MKIWILIEIKSGLLFILSDYVSYDVGQLLGGLDFAVCIAEEHDAVRNLLVQLFLAVFPQYSGQRLFVKFVDQIRGGYWVPSIRHVKRC